MVRNKEGWSHHLRGAKALVLPGCLASHIPRAGTGSKPVPGQLC